MKTAKLSTFLLIALSTLGLVSSLYGQNPTANMMAPAQMNLMPVPASVQIQTGRLPITSSFKVAIKNYTDDRLRAGIDRMLRHLAGRTVLTLPADLATDEGAALLVVQCERAGASIPSLNENESYSLGV